MSIRLEISRRAADLGRELGIPHVAGVANKIRDEPTRRLSPPLPPPPAFR
jgi:CO dehydrogenase nickel-insertion accessory protein CooC1